MRREVLLLCLMALAAAGVFSNALAISVEAPKK